PSVRRVFKRSRRTPTPGEVAQIVRYFEEHERPWLPAALRLQAGLGCRIGELGELTWDRVDLEVGTVTLVGKTGPRTVPLRPDLAELIASLPRTREFVLGRRHTTVRRQLNPKVQLACRRLGIQPFTSHGLRRLAVDTLARSGVDVGTAAAMLGHSPLVMLQAYRQVSLEDLGVAARALPPLPRGDVVPFPGAANASGHNSRSQPAGDTPVTPPTEQS
ncbi:MAG: site-specific integrase, partial [Myxococcota bacterium]